MPKCIGYLLQLSFLLLPFSQYGSIKTHSPPISIIPPPFAKGGDKDSNSHFE